MPVRSHSWNHTCLKYLALNYCTISGSLSCREFYWQFVQLFSYRTQVGEITCAWEWTSTTWRRLHDKRVSLRHASKKLVTVIYESESSLTHVLRPVWSHLYVFFLWEQIRRVIQSVRMGRKRKRPGHFASDKAPVSSLSKRQKTHHPAASAHRPHSHPVLGLYYPKVQSLREYMLSVLPDSSKSRRRKIASVRYDFNVDDIELKSAGDKDQGESDDSKLAHLLDSTLVGIGDVTKSESICRSKDFELFSQQLSSTIASSLGGGTLSQPEVRASLFF